MPVIKLSLAILIAAIYACDERKAMVYPVYPPALDSLVQLFFYEASQRGIVPDNATGLTIEFKAMQGNHSGMCTPNSFPKTIVIDSIQWKYIMTSRERERLLFHEMAHCLLRRKHVDDKLMYGECKSWMRSDNGVCAMNLDSDGWRAYYLDELFDPDRGAPYWYAIDQRICQPEQLKKLSKFSITHSTFDDTLHFANGEDWLIEVESIFKPSDLVTLLIQYDETFMAGYNRSLYPRKDTIAFLAKLGFGEPFHHPEQLHTGQETFRNGKIVFSIQHRRGTTTFFINGTARHSMSGKQRKVFRVSYAGSGEPATIGYYQLNKGHP